MVMRELPPESGPFPAPKPIVLVVDDDLEALAALRRALRSDSYNILSTDDPFQALEWAKSGSIALVITDEFMPVMLGTELLEAVHRASPDTATVLLTGYPKPAVMFRGFQQRVDLMLAKPWGDQALREAALRLLREHAPRSGDGKPPKAFRTSDRIKEH
ncbi:MAG TPA: response regulator [Planctomycetota bacterium]|nr:response regulator [Planctomycetota bacterium]